jgi:hypothetical protein
MLRPLKDGTNQVGVAGKPLPQAFLVQVVNSVTGEPAAGVVVTWSTYSAGAAIAPLQVTSDLFGSAPSYFVASTISGTQHSVATLGDQTETFSIQVRGDLPTTLTAWNPLVDTLPANRESFFLVELKDQYGNDLDDVPLTWTFSGSGAITRKDEVTQQGNAALYYMTGSLPGSISATATVAGLPAITFTAVVQ